MNLENLLVWSEAKEVITARGKAMLRTAPASGAFWAEWKKNKAGLQALGISPIKQDDAWIVRWYGRGEKAPAPVVSAPVKPAINWSSEQQAIFTWFATGKTNVIIRARAGTGKTTTIKAGFTHAPEEKILYAVFNKKNQVEAASAIFDPRVEIKTLHSLGFMFIKQVWVGAKPDSSVETDRVEKIVGEQAPASAKTQVRKLVGFAKNTLINPTHEDMLALAEERGIECPEYADPENGGYTTHRIAKLALEVLDLSREQDKYGRISFDDMVWLPVVMGWVRAWYDLVVVDEAQDMNLPQLLMAKSACKLGGRVCVVGDDRQAIYNFRGAASDGMDMMKRELSAEELGLTITYRCPKAVVEIASKMVPDYRAGETAPEGIVSSLEISALEAKLTVGDAVLSRANAPLMPICISLLRKGIPARVEGKDIGKALLDIFNRINARTVPQFLTKLEAWKEKECARYADTKNAEAKTQQVIDYADTLHAISEGVSGVKEIEDRLNFIFEDSSPESKAAIVLSTAHKAKGLEWSRVFLLSSTFNRKPAMNGPVLPPEATAKQAREEQNIYYVAVTRAKAELTMVHGEFKRK